MSTPKTGIRNDWRFRWAIQAAGMLLIALISTYLPLLFPYAATPLRAVFLWILPCGFGAWSACYAARCGLISYAAWLLPPILHSIVPWIAIGFPPPPLSMLLCAFISLVGAAAGDVLYKYDTEQ